MCTNGSRTMSDEVQLRTLSQQLVLTGSFDASSLALRVSALTGVAAEDVSVSSSTAADGSTVVSLSVLARGGPGAAALAQQALEPLVRDHRRHLG